MSRLLFAILFLVSFSVIAQTTTQSVLWTHAQLKVHWTNDWTLQQDFEEAVFWFPFRQHIFQERTLVTKGIGSGIRLGAGFIYFTQQLPNNPHVESLTTVHELRPFLHLSHKWHVNEHIAIHQRLWPEFRFFKGVDHYEYVTTRVRYRLMAQLPISDWGRLDLYDEVHVNTFRKSESLTNRLDQNRIGFNLWYTGFEHHKFAAGYFNWYQERIPTGSFFSRHIVRLTYSYQI